MRRESVVRTREARDNWLKLRLLSVALTALLIAHSAHGQTWQFQFDALGNLQVQTAETSAPPRILAPPQNQVAAPGATASFTVVVADTRGLTYQWRFNGTPINNATTEALLLTGVDATNEGQYSVLLTNPFGSVTSAPALLMLDADGDGLPDSWELAYFGNLDQTAVGDFDGDGVSNLDEFLQGTNPTDSASALFRLTLLSDGGQVEISPTKPAYTNGEIVTLTTSDLGAETFHMWTGDMITRANPLTIAMTTNRVLFAHFRPVDFIWQNAAGGDWNVGTNWNWGLVPGTNDTAYVTNGSVTVTVDIDTECGSLILGGAFPPTISGTGALTLHGKSTWSGGTMSGSGRTVIAPGATLAMSSGGGFLVLSSRTLENGGTATWTGAGGIYFINGVITNRLGALFHAQNAAPFSSSGAGRFDNSGTFRKSATTGATTIGAGVSFNNFGVVEVQSGTLSLAGGGTNVGTYNLAAGTTFNLSGGAFSSAPGAVIAGSANLVVSGGTATLDGLVSLTGGHIFSGGVADLNGGYFCTNNTLTISGGTANFKAPSLVAPTNLTFSGGTLGGSALVTALGQMTWSSGTMSGSGRTVIAPGATLAMNSGGGFLVLSSRTLENGGTATWTGAGGIYFIDGVITNRPGALFHAQNAAAFSSSGAGRFDNAGTFRKSASTGATTIANGVAFNNYDTLDLQSGIVAANGGFTFGSNAWLNCALGGLSPGTGYGQLQVAGVAAVQGGLSVDLVNGFIPSTNASFSVLNAGTRGGTFANFSYPSNLVSMQLSNSPTAIIITVTGVNPPAPVIFAPQVVGTDLKLTWTAVSNLTYRVEFNPDLDPSNWNAIPGDVTATASTASKLDPLTPTNRNYRVRLVP